MELQITTLIENMPDDAGELACEHGLSLYIEFGGKKILFDTGQTGEFFSNAQKLGKDIADVDWVVISHGHYDHSGGVPRLVEKLSRPLSMYIGAEFFHKKYKHLSDGTYRYNGNPFLEADLPAEKLALHKITEDITYLEENIMLFKNFMRFTDYEKPNPKFAVERTGATATRKDLLDGAGESRDLGADEMVMAEGGDVPNYEPDDFRDELALGLRTTKGLVLVVGCSHVGIVNILRTVMERTGLPVYSVLGGTHLVEADEERLEKTMEALQECGLAQIAVSHCTGEPGMERVAWEFGGNFVKNNTGHVYMI